MARRALALPLALMGGAFFAAAGAPAGVAADQPTATPSTYGPAMDVRLPEARGGAESGSESEGKGKSSGRQGEGRWKLGGDEDQGWPYAVSVATYLLFLLVKASAQRTNSSS